MTGYKVSETMSIVHRMACVLKIELEEFIVKEQDHEAQDYAACMILKLFEDKAKRVVDHLAPDKFRERFL